MTVLYDTTFRGKLVLPQVPRAIENIYVLQANFSSSITFGARSLDITLRKLDTGPVPQYINLRALSN